MEEQITVLDRFIEITMILLILSIVTEKIIDFIKIHFPNTFYTRYLNSEDKIKKSRKNLQFLAISIGISVALVTKVSIFDIYLNPEYEMFWRSCEDNIFRSILGSIITGVFLSIGSKFFHDLLGLLFEIKQNKRKLNNRKGWEFTNLNQVDEYLKGNNKQEIERLLEQYKELFPEIISYELNIDEMNVVFTLRSYLTEIPNQITLKSERFGLKYILSVQKNMMS